MSLVGAVGLGVLTLLLGGCGPTDTTPFTFGFPSGATTGTEILVVTAPDRTSAYVIPLDRPSFRLPVEVTSESSVGLEALLYDEPLTALGLSAGPLMASAAGTPTRPPHTTHRGRIEGGAFGGWEERAAPSTEAAAFQAPLPCAEFEVAPPTYGQEIFFGGAARVDGTTALILTGTATETVGHYYLADSLGVRRISDPVPTNVAPTRILGTPGRVFLAASAGPDDWSTMYAGDPRRGLERIPPRPRSSSCGVSGMDYARDGSAAPAVYVIDACGSLDRFTGGVWTHLLDAEIGGYYARRRLAWVGPDELVFPAGDGVTLMRFRDGRAEPMTTEVAVDKIQTVATVDGVGTFAGLLSGWVLQYADDGWRAFRGPFIAAVSVESFGPLDGDLLVGGSDGDVQQWIGRTKCPATTYVGVNHNVLGLAELDDGLVVAGVVGTDNRTFFGAFLRQAR